MAMMRFTKHQILKESIENNQITPPQFGMLHCLKCVGPQTMKDIAQNMDLTHGACTGLIDRLHKLGLVERERPEHDRRVVTVNITEAGEHLIQRIQEKRHAILRKIISQLTPEESRLLLKIHSFAKEKLQHYAD